VLPDDVLLAIFDFCVVRYQYSPEMVISDRYARREIVSWQSLVHVCRRWRRLIFESPRRLNLQPFCTTGTSARKTLDIWPAFPLLIQDHDSETSVDNIVAVLEHSNRILQISLRCLTTSQWYVKGIHPQYLIGHNKVVMI